MSATLLTYSNAKALYTAVVLYCPRLFSDITNSIVSGHCS